MNPFYGNYIYFIIQREISFSFRLDPVWPSVWLIKRDNARPVSPPRAEISELLYYCEVQLAIARAILTYRNIRLNSIPIKMTAFSHKYSICRTKSIAHAIFAMASIILIEKPWSWYWNVLNAPMCQEDTQLPTLKTRSHQRNEFMWMNYEVVLLERAPANEEAGKRSIGHEYATRHTITRVWHRMASSSDS